MAKVIRGLIVLVLGAVAGTIFNELNDGLGLILSILIGLALAGGLAALWTFCEHGPRLTREHRQLLRWAADNGEQFLITDSFFNPRHVVVGGRTLYGWDTRKMSGEEPVENATRRRHWLKIAEDLMGDFVAEQGSGVFRLTGSGLKMADRIQNADPLPDCELEQTQRKLAAEKARRTAAEVRRSNEAHEQFASDPFSHRKKQPESQGEGDPSLGSDLDKVDTTQLRRISEAGKGRVVAFWGEAQADGSYSHRAVMGSDDSNEELDWHSVFRLWRYDYLESETLTGPKSVEGGEALVIAPKGKRLLEKLRPEA